MKNKGGKNMKQKLALLLAIIFILAALVPVLIEIIGLI